jgi:hypothetical protein
MEPTSPELDTIADLLRRWQGVDGPMERVRVVSDAADALRGLSTLDARTLAQGLWEHGAGPAAQQVADRAGTSVAPEELSEVASAVLSLDRDEVDRLATELRDPQQRQRLLVASGIATEEAARHVASAPPSDQDRIDAPPPPGEASTTQPVPGADTDAPLHRDTGRDGPPARDAPPGEPPTDGRDGAEAEAPAPTPPSAATTRAARRATGKPGWHLAAQLQDAPNGRERLRLLDEVETVLHGAAALRILDAVPDGWQRRTILRKLVTADRVRDLLATDVVDRFARNGDRFAAAALLVRTGTCDLDDVLPALDPSDAARLRRRASAQRSDTQGSEAQPPDVQPSEP